MSFNNSLPTCGVAILSYVSLQCYMYTVAVCMSFFSLQVLVVSVFLVIKLLDVVFRMYKSCSMCVK